jgi:glycosyltransferase involved in cell wall biosynthesis
VTAIVPEDLTPDLPPNIVNLPFVYQFSLPYYERYVLKLPSLLASLKQMYALAPDRIFISTPGPLGLMGLIAARLLHVRCVGVYHTDFTLESREIVNDASVAEILESYTRWFYNQMDEIRVPTAVYRDLLEQRGLAASKMTIFRRGINSAFFSPKVSDRWVLEEQCGIRDGISLLYAGRISRDKGLEFLARLYLRLCEERSDLNLLIAGDGPYLDEMRGMLSGTRAVFTGRVGQETLPALYGASELFLFPSTTDTFGKAVLEAQSCGLPAIVSNLGGPQEIVAHGRTGYVAEAGSFTDWEAKIRLILDMIESRPEVYRQMRKEARMHVLDNFHWDSAFADITDDGRIPDEKEEKKIA